MPALLSMSACSQDREDSTQGETEEKMGGCTFSSDLRLYVIIIRRAGGERELIGETPSGRPLAIPRCASWGVFPIGPVDMKALAREIAAKKIPQLYLRWTQITDAGLAHLEGLTELRGLYLAGPRITDAGLAHLKGLTGLLKLDLGRTKITDAGLAHLKGLTGLRFLYLLGTKITDAGLADLTKALPKTQILP